MKLSEKSATIRTWRISESYFPQRSHQRRWDDQRCMTTDTWCRKLGECPAPSDKDGMWQAVMRMFSSRIMALNGDAMLGHLDWTDQKRLLYHLHFSRDQKVPSIVVLRMDQDPSCSSQPPRRALVEALSLVRPSTTTGSKSCCGLQSDRSTDERT